MAKRNIPTHPEGWKFAGTSGLRGVVFQIWNVGRNDYRITNAAGEVVDARSQFGEAHMRASKLAEIELWQAAQAA